MKTLKSILSWPNDSVTLYALILTCACIFFFNPVRSQPITGIEQTKGILLAYQAPEQISSSNNISVLHSEGINDRFDRSILDYVNEMRADPKAFYEKYIPDYIRENSRRFTARYTRSLKKEMLRSQALPGFEPTSALRKTATLQLDYLAQYKGRMLTHDQGNIGFAERMNRAGLHCLAENLYTADDPKALNVVLDLLIDEGVPSFGHRKNLMNPMYTHIGIVSKTPRGGRMIVVMDFGCKY